LIKSWTDLSIPKYEGFFFLKRVNMRFNIRNAEPTKILLKIAANFQSKTVSILEILLPWVIKCMYSFLLGCVHSYLDFEYISIFTLIWREKSQYARLWDGHHGLVRNLSNQWSNQMK
jgi:hypothetical protein